MSDTTSGLALLLVAGIANASFALPMKFTRRWAWENTWLVFAVFALLVLPTVVTLATVPNLVQVYAGILPMILIVAAFGAGWGVAQVLFGLSVDLLGIALTFSIVLGISAAVGSMIPLIRLHPQKVFSGGGLGVMAGISLVILGVVICAIAWPSQGGCLWSACRCGENFADAWAYIRDLQRTWRRHDEFRPGFR